jgi:ATPase family associated with various cellular activities (AAA)
MPPYYTTNLDHLRDELRRLDLLLERAVLQFRARRDQDKSSEFRGLYISDEEIDDLMTVSDENPRKAWAETDNQVELLHNAIQQRVNESRAAGVTLRLPHLCAVFGLSPFETDLLLLALAPELDLHYQKLYAYLQDDVTHKRPSVDLALRVLCLTLEERVNARELFASGSPLFDIPLLVLHEDPAERPCPLLSRSLKLDDRIAEFLLGSDRLDRRLCSPPEMARWIVPKREMDSLILPETVKAPLEKIASLDTINTSWLCILQGPAGVGKKACAEAICREQGRSLFVLDLPALVKSDLPLQTLLRVAFREAHFYRNNIYLDGWHELFTSEPRHQLTMRLVEQEIEQFKGLIFLGTRSPWQPGYPCRYQFIQIDLPLPDERSRQTLWETYLGDDRTVSTNVDLDYLASAFRFSGGQIQRAIAQAESHAWLRQGADCQLTTDDLLAGCRLESSQHLIAFAKKITPKRVWQDLALPKDTLSQLHEFCQQVRYRTQVYTDWGFGQKLSLGKGAIALFTGDSGTGKTLSAEILAKDLGLDLYKVDLALVVSKYIGETEKNLSRVFQEARDSNAILFFDEADALFGKRSEVKDAHDRYANIEINYLLQRVEEYEGVIILASNLSKNIDPAFLRRLHFSIEFPFPDENHRKQIWRNIFPAQVPLASDVDFDFLARKFKIAGGNIKNIALAAAFRAAENSGAVGMEHLIQAMKREYQKLGRVCERTEFEKYYDFIR